MQAIKEDDDVRRVVALPRREPEISEERIDEITDLLAVRDRCPGAKLPADDDGLCRQCGVPMRLRPLQALALDEIAQQRGAFLPLDVGEGKTLISLLAPAVLEAKRPLLLLRANLIGKTAREWRELARHWDIPKNIRMMSYQMLGLVQYEAEIELYGPDLFLWDEAQALKNLDAAVTRRVARRMAKNPQTMCVGMTGTIMRKDITDFAHILLWCLKAGAPVPSARHRIEEWALAMAENLDDEFRRIAPGALLQLATPEMLADLKAGRIDEAACARLAFNARLRATPGVICSAASGTKVDAEIVMRPLRYDVQPITQQHYVTLRDEKKTPEGYDIWEAAEVWRHARELALGFHQVWDPQPPEPWRIARKAWFAFVRQVLQRTRLLDSPEHVAQACLAGKLDDRTLRAWLAIKDTYTPSPVPYWHDDSALHAAARWMRQHPGGIVWVDFVPFGERLADLTGCKYFGAEGFSRDGTFIDDADAAQCVIASQKANKEGRNLQLKRHRNLVTTPWEGHDLWHQVIGRTHRPRQPEPVVYVDVFFGCGEHVNAWRKALAGARTTRETVGSQSKLLIADTRAMPTEAEFATWRGPRWEK